MSDVRHPAVFFDRDGTLNEEVNYLHKIENFEWVSGAPQAVKRLNDLGIPVLVVTNQSGVARGYYTEDDVDRLHAWMNEELAEVNAKVDAFYYCPFHPEGTVEKYRALSHCRKPNPGMFEEAIGEWGVDPTRSFVVGDKNTDLIPGNELGMTTILVRTGHGASEDDTVADHLVADVGAAVELIERAFEDIEPTERDR
ncbi:MAG TPA: HAD family hydrolase [Salinibacter sp.]|nr:HAD family hydrolase [Salinibacter sp.]